MIYFAAKLKRDTSGQVYLSDWYFHYSQRGPTLSIRPLFDRLRARQVRRDIGQATYEDHHSGARVALAGGPGKKLHGANVLRLLRQEPRASLPVGQFPLPNKGKFDFLLDGPTALYVGSGLSYESGLPTLADVHMMFGVDSISASQFTFGDQDPIPDQLSTSVAETFARFVSLYVQAASAEPSYSHFRIAEYYRQGLITRVLTDNVDNLFSTCGIPFQRTRTTFPGRVECKFNREEKSLLVIGVAADRREIVSQAREQGVRIIAVNPEDEVSPRAQNLSYLREVDDWYRMRAKEFFTSHVMSFDDAPVSLSSSTTRLARVFAASKCSTA